jgi:hypothetical protein
MKMLIWFCGFFGDVFILIYPYCSGKDTIKKDLLVVSDVKRDKLEYGIDIEVD